MAPVVAPLATPLATSLDSLSRAVKAATAASAEPETGRHHILHHLGSSSSECLSTAESEGIPRAARGASVVVVSSMPLRYLVSGLQAHLAKAGGSHDVTDKAAFNNRLSHQRQPSVSSHQATPAQGAADVHLVASCLALSIPLFVTYDPDPSHVLPSSMPSLITAENIFEAVPGLRRLLQVRAADRCRRCRRFGLRAVCLL